MAKGEHCLWLAAAILLLVASCSGKQSRALSDLKDDMKLLDEVLEALRDAEDEKPSGLDKRQDDLKGDKPEDDDDANEVDKYPTDTTDDDLITSLPGLASHEQPMFNQYSGYLQTLGTRRLHYW